MQACLNSFFSLNMDFEWLEDILELDYNNVHREREFRERRNFFNIHNDVEFKEKFHMNKGTVRFLTDLLNLQLEHDTNRNHALSTELQILIT